MTTDFPAVNGAVVTEAHTRTCRERGHATHTVDGADTGRCPRCGEVKPRQTVIVAVSPFEGMRFAAIADGMYTVYSVDESNQTMVVKRVGDYSATLEPPFTVNYTFNTL